MNTKFLKRKKEGIKFFSIFIELGIAIVSACSAPFAVPGAILGIFYPKVSENLLNKIDTEYQTWIFVSKSSEYIETIEKNIKKILDNKNFKKQYNYSSYSIDIVDNFLYLLDIGNKEIEDKDIVYTVYIRLDNKYDEYVFEFIEDFRQINFNNKITYSSNKVVSSDTKTITKDIIYRLSNNLY